MRPQRAVPSRSLAVVSTALGPRQMNLAELIQVLRRRWRTVAASMLLLLGPALAYTIVAKPEYTAVAELFVDPRPKRGTEQETIPSGLGQDISLVESQVRIIASDAVMGRTVDKLKLDQDPEFAKGGGNGWIGRLRQSARALLMGETTADRRLDNPKLAARDALAKAVRLKRPEKTYIIAIEATSHDPDKAALIAQTIAETYLSDQSSAKSDDARQVNENVAGRLDELRARVKEADAKVEDFKRRNAVVMSEGSLVNEQQLTRINTELVSAKGATAVARARYDQVQQALRAGGSPESLTEAVNSPLIQRLRAQLTTTAREEAQLRTALLPAHPRLVQVRSDLDELKKQIAAELKRIGAAAQGEWDIARRREATLEKELETLKVASSTMNQSRIGLGELEQEAEANRQLLRLYLARAKETGEQSTFYRPDARILTPASAPSQPSRPQRLLILALGLAGGLALGLGRALFAEMNDTRVRTRGDLEQDRLATGMDLGDLASVPMLAPAGGLPMLRRRVSFHQIFEAIMHGHGTSADPFRAAIFRLVDSLRPAPGATQPRIVLVTSPQRGDGKSSLVAAVGMAAALQGERVLLIDADQVDPQLSAVFGGGLAPNGEVRLDVAAGLERLLVEDEKLPLAILPLGIFRDAPQQRTVQQKMLADLKAIAGIFDLVLIDGGSHPGSVMARLVASTADTALVCTKAGTATRETVTGVWSELTHRRTLDGGCVVTMT